MSNITKPTYAHTPGSGRPSLAQQHETRQTYRAAQDAAKKAQPGAAPAQTGFTGDIPPGATIHVAGGVIVGYN